MRGKCGICAGCAVPAEEAARTGNTISVAASPFNPVRLHSDWLEEGPGQRVTLGATYTRRYSSGAVMAFLLNLRRQAAI